MSENINDKTTYYYSNGQRIPLVRDPDAFAVRFRGGAKSDSAGLSTEARTLLRRGTEHIGFIPKHNLQIYRRVEPPADAVSMSPGPRLFSRLAAEPEVEFAAPVYRRGTSGDVILTTRKFVAQFKSHITREQIDEFNSRHGVRILSALDYADNAYLLEAPETDGPRGPVALGNVYFESGLTEFAHANLIKRQYWRSAPALPARTVTAVSTRFDTERNAYQVHQWHLANANIIDAWTITRGRPDIRICILDDGIDIGHAEFAGKVVAQFDFENDVSDASPKLADDRHGTPCAGVATARGAKALGAAPACSLIAGRTPWWGEDSEYARMFKWAADQNADVISCSWGPEDRTGAIDPLPDVIRTAIRYCVTQGRGGKGCAVLFAAGNGEESVSNDGYASNPDVMAIAASNDQDGHAWYSDFGPEISICAPSNGGTRGILTADRRGANGYNTVLTGVDIPPQRPGDDPQIDSFQDLDYTSTFGGTSSSTPLVAGIIGLMLSVNPDLTAGQIRQCLQNTATKIGSPQSYDSRGHSHFFGFGKVNAAAAVREAQRLLGTVTPVSMPTIQAQQQSVSRTGPPPSFTIDARPNTHYQVEIAARPELLDTRPGPTSEYYASWEHTPFMSAPSFTLPQAAWDRIKNNARLYFRAWTSSSGTTWTNTLATTGELGGTAAEFIEITSQQTPVATGRPTITGPTSISRFGPPPSFTIDPRPNTHYAIEIGARPELLDAQSGQPENEYYGTWSEAFMTARTFQLRPEVWDQLKGNQRLYYRVWTSSNSESWTDILLSADTGAESPLMEISGDGVLRDIDRSKFARRVLPPSLPTQRPAITGPETANAAGLAPVFHVEPGRNSYYCIEVAVDPADFARSDARESLSPSRFYGSWVDGMKMAEGLSTTYVLPQEVWKRLSRTALAHGGRLYYRLITASESDRTWPDAESSLPDDDYRQAPGIDVWMRPERISRIGGRDEEVLWRGRS